MSARVIVETGFLAGKAFNLQPGKPLKVGRGPANSIQVLDRSLSRNHCEFVIEPDGTVLVRDLGSSGGTFVERRKITEQALDDGTRVALGTAGVTIRVERDSAPEDAEALDLAPEEEDEPSVGDLPTLTDPDSLRRSRMAGKEQAATPSPEDKPARSPLRFRPGGVGEEAPPAEPEKDEEEDLDTRALDAAGSGSSSAGLGDTLCLGRDFGKTEAPAETPARPLPETLDETDDLDPVVGLSFAGYRVQSVLGEDLFGLVCKAFHQAMERDAIVRALKPDAARRPEAVERFRNYSKIAQRLTHPGLVRLIDAGQAHGYDFVVKDYVDGPALRRQIAEQGAMDPTTAVNLARQVAKALVALHNQGLVHGRVQPGNILLDSSGRPRLANAGLHLPVRLPSGELDRAQVECLPCIGPEAIESDPQRSSDIYGLGASLYYMLTGVLPYQEENPDALVQSIKAGQAIPVSRYRSDVPPRLAELIDQMLQADPAARPETAEGVLVRLTEAAEGDV